MCVLFVHNVRSFVHYAAVDGGIKGPSMKTTIPGPKTKVNNIMLI